MKQQSVSFTTSQHAALLQEAKAEGCSLADVVRRAVDMWMTKRGNA